MIDAQLPPLVVGRKTGRELFHDRDAPLGFDLMAFWQWSASDLVSNALRGRLAEFLVAQALGITGAVRAEWDAYDLRTPDGMTIEVKSAAYVQSWTQRRISAICFDVAPTRFWDATTNSLASESRRQAALYVFGLLARCDKATIDPMNVSQWEFFILPTAVLNTRMPSQKQMSLATLLKLDPERCEFRQLKGVVEKVSRAACLTA